MLRLTKILRTDDPTDEIGAAWAIKELLRQLLAAHGPTRYSRSGTAHLRTRFLTACVDADMPETTRLAATIERWWPEIEPFLALGVTNARTEGHKPGDQTDQTSRLRVPEPSQLRKAHHDAQRDPPGRVNQQRSRSTPLKVEEPCKCGSAWEPVDQLKVAEGNSTSTRRPATASSRDWLRGEVRRGRQRPCQPNTLRRNCRFCTCRSRDASTASPV